MQFSPKNPQSCKLSIKKSEILTFHMQKRGDLQGLVKGLFLTGKKFFPVGSLPDQINREPFCPTGQTGAPVNFFFSRPHRAIWGSAPAGTCLPTVPWKLNKKALFLIPPIAFRFLDKKHKLLPGNLEKCLNPGGLSCRMGRSLSIRQVLPIFCCP